MQSALVKQGYEVNVSVPGLQAIRQMLIEEPDLVVLGMNSHQDDWSFCRRLLTFLDRPLMLMLSTRNKLDRVRALELGADDCMVKPIITVEAVARIRALLRRSRADFSRPRRGYYVDGDLVVDMSRREAWVNDQPVALTPTEFRLLCCFASHEGEIISHDRLIVHVWGPDYTGARDAVKLYVHQLRKKIEPDPRQPRRILTRRGEGYLFQRIGDQRVPD
jgi:DNA-binding response OmpR family regulator